MKLILSVPLSCLLATAALAQTGPVTTTAKSDLPVTVTVTVAPAKTDGPAYEQQLYTPATSTLVAPDKARLVVENFRATYEKLGKPSLLLYINRELVDTASGLHVTARKEHIEGEQVETKSSYETDPTTPKSPVQSTAAGPQTQVTVITGGVNSTTATPGKTNITTSTTRVTADNTYARVAQPATALADRQTVRDIERLFGRPLRAGGSRLADQRAATDLMADKPIDHFTVATDETARKDREALACVADVVIEVLISTRKLTVPGISGEETVAIPDITATAIRLKDSVIIGQASASDVLGKKSQAARLARQFDVNDIAEATALALMEDIALTGGN